VVVIDPAAEAAGAPAPLARAMFDLSLPGAVQQAILAGKPTAYACLGPQCSLPVTEPEVLRELLRTQQAA
jgi:hypothetical protein